MLTDQINFTFLYNSLSHVKFLKRYIPDFLEKSGILFFNKKTQAEIKINFACMIISDKSTKQTY